MTSVEEIYKKLLDSKSDFEKGHKGNKAAATRARNTLSDIAKLCKEARKELLDASKGERSDDISITLF